MANTTAPNSVNERPKLSLDQLRRSLRIFSYVLPYKWSFLASMLAVMFSSLLFLAIMQIPGEWFKIINGESEYGVSLNGLFGILVVLLALMALLSYIRTVLMTLVSERSMQLLREEFYQKLLSLGVPFFEENRVGEITSRISNDITRIQSTVSVTLGEFLRQIILLVGGVIYILVAMPRLALLMLATFPVVIISAMFFGRYVRRLTKERQEYLANTNVVVEETMQSIQTVKAYTNEWFEIGRFRKNLEETVLISLKAARVRGGFAAFIILVMMGSLFFIMWRAALMVQSGDLPSGDLVNLVIFTTIIGGAIASLGNFYTEIVAAVGATDRIQDILDMEVEQELKTSHEPTNRRFAGAIDLEDIQFAYPTRPDVPVLKGINIHIQPGERIALVGASGSGKSTIMKLLLRFYQPSAGNLLVDGAPQSSYDINSYRQNLAVVPQEVLLFGGTIGENILYGRPDATPAEVEAAARQANAWEFIQSFPEGLETIVGERGIKLSGGQRQRIAIARAILKDPAILLLDEATSSLDAESEKVVQDALNKLMENRTSIVIAHRLATIRDVDRIYVMDQGRIVEEGTHAELSSIPNGTYNSLAKLQFDLVE